MNEQSSPRDIGHTSTHAVPEHHDIVKVMAWLVVASITIGALYIGKTVLIPLAIAFLIGFAFNPLVTWLTRRGLPQLLSVIAVILTLCMFLAALGLLVGSQVRTLSAELPTYESTIREKIRNLRESIKAPGIFEGALHTVDTVQNEVDAASSPATTDTKPPPQRVTIVEQPKSPIETAVAWLTPALEPLATAGIVLVFVFLVLLDRGDLRDRLIRLLGGNLHRSTDAMEEAGTRISKYLLMQLVVNVSYGVPMAIGLWFIGVPGWLLWGTLAALMRFIPYVGPALSAIFPLALAFAVDPGWSMVLWTVALIVFLELISNNIVEPLLYGTSTGLSAISLIASATFWTALWGPVGLILSTPLTVCLLVIGRTNPQLAFLDTLLGSTPVLDVPTRIYQRLIADDPEEALEIIGDAVKDNEIAEFYHEYGIEVLRRVNEDYLVNARPEHRLRVSNGMDTILDDLREEYPAALPAESKPRIACIGGRWEIDSIACEMLAHALGLTGLAAVQRREGVVTAQYVNKLDLDGIDIVCLSYFSREPATSIKTFCKRLRNRWPKCKVVIALWNAPESLLEDGAINALGADEVVTTVREAVLRIQRMIAPEEALIDVKFAVISAIDANDEYIIGQSVDLPGTRTRDGTDMITMPRDEAICNHVVAAGERLVVSDTLRDPRFVDHPAIRLWDTGSYAGAPLKTADGKVFGAFCLLDSEPRTFSDEELTLLDSMAADVVSLITGDDLVDTPAQPPERPPTNTVAQRVPD